MDAAFRHYTHIIALPQLPALTPSFSLGADKVLQVSRFKTFAFYLSRPPFMSGHESCINFDNEIPARKKLSCSCNWWLNSSSSFSEEKKKKKKKKTTNPPTTTTRQNKTKNNNNKTTTKTPLSPREKGSKQTKTKKLNNTTARGTLYNFLKVLKEHYFHPKQTPRLKHLTMTIWAIWKFDLGVEVPGEISRRICFFVFCLFVFSSTMLSCRSGEVAEDTAHA